MHGYGKKFDTQNADQKEPGVLCGSVYTSLATVTPKQREGNPGIMNRATILQAKATPSEGSQFAQKPKQVNLRANAPNQSNGGIWDPTASILCFQRVRRRRNYNSTETWNRKYSTTRKPTRKGEILDAPIYRVVLSELNKYRQKDGTFNGISRIMTPDMLKSCYYLIKSNPGNMTQGTTKETLDRINDK